LIDARAEAGVADELSWRREAGDVADLGRDRVGEYPADPGYGQKQRHVVVVGAQPAQFSLAGRDLPVELVDQLQAGGDCAGPRFGQRQPLQQRAAGDAEQVGDRAGLAVREQGGVDPLLETAAVADEMGACAFFCVSVGG
jgi:hypothetical protein